MTGNGNHTTYLWWFGGWLMAFTHSIGDGGLWLPEIERRWWHDVLVKSRWEWPQGPRSHPSTKFNKHQSNMFYFQKVMIQSPKLNLFFFRSQLLVGICWVDLPCSSLTRLSVKHERRTLSPASGLVAASSVVEPQSREENRDSAPKSVWNPQNSYNIFKIFQDIEEPLASFWFNCHVSCVFFSDMLDQILGWVEGKLCGIDPYSSIFHQQGLVNVPFWGYWTSPYSSHYRPYT